MVRLSHVSHYHSLRYTLYTHMYRQIIDHACIKCITFCFTTWFLLLFAGGYFFSECLMGSLCCPLVPTVATQGTMRMGSEMEIRAAEVKHNGGLGSCVEDVEDVAGTTNHESTDWTNDIPLKNGGFPSSESPFPGGFLYFQGRTVSFRGRLTAGTQSRHGGLESVIFRIEKIGWMWCFQPFTFQGV